MTHNRIRKPFGSFGWSCALTTVPQLAWKCGLPQWTGLQRKGRRWLPEVQVSVFTCKYYRVCQFCLLKKKKYWTKPNSWSQASIVYSLYFESTLPYSAVKHLWISVNPFQCGHSQEPYFKKYFSAVQHVWAGVHGLSWMWVLICIYLTPLLFKVKAGQQLHTLRVAIKNKKGSHYSE